MIARTHTVLLGKCQGKCCPNGGHMAALVDLGLIGKK